MVVYGFRIGGLFNGVKIEYYDFYNVGCWKILIKKNIIVLRNNFFL